MRTTSTTKWRLRCTRHQRVITSMITMPPSACSRSSYIRDKRHQGAAAARYARMLLQGLSVSARQASACCRHCGRCTQTLRPPPTHVQPALDVVEALLLCDVVHHQRPHSAAVVSISNRAVPLLPCSLVGAATQSASWAVMGSSMEACSRVWQQCAYAAAGAGSKRGHIAEVEHAEVAGSPAVSHIWHFTTWSSKCNVLVANSTPAGVQPRSDGAAAGHAAGEGP